MPPKPPRDAPADPRPGNPRGVVWILAPAAISLAVSLAYGPLFVDDAYITFRYAENLAAGRGLVFNPEGKVLGTTSPLLAGGLAAFRVLGVEIPAAARWIGIAGVAATAALVAALALRGAPPLAAAAAGSITALHPLMSFAAASGMETGASLAAVFGCFHLAASGRWALAGAAGGAAALLRPDGLLAAIVAAAMALPARPRAALRVLLAAAGIVLPWIACAAWAYGSPVPASIAAKQFIHPAPPAANLRLLLAGLTPDPAAAALLVLAAAGLVVAAVARSRLAWVGAWMVLYAGGLCVSGIEAFFDWYRAPLVPGLALLAACALGRIADLRGGARASGRWAAAAAFAAVGIGLASGIYPARAALRAEGQDRVERYLAIGAAIDARYAPGRTILVGEVGALGWRLMRHRILDSAGINSPEILRLRREDRERLLRRGAARPPAEGTPAWVAEAIARHRPDLVVTYRPWLHVGAILATPGISAAYRRIDLGLDLPDYVILERR
jgi:hypothetical protein